MAPFFASGQIPLASQILEWCVSKGFEVTQVKHGGVLIHLEPVGNGGDITTGDITEVILKLGSPDAEGSGSPHVSIRVDTSGTPGELGYLDPRSNERVSKKSDGNHVQILWDIEVLDAAGLDKVAPAPLPEDPAERALLEQKEVWVRDLLAPTLGMAPADLRAYLSRDGMMILQPAEFAPGAFERHPVPTVGDTRLQRRVASAPQGEGEAGKEAEPAGTEEARRTERSPDSVQPEHEALRRSLKAVAEAAEGELPLGGGEGSLRNEARGSRGALEVGWGHATGYAQFCAVLLAYHSASLMLRYQRGEATLDELGEEVERLVLSREAVSGYFSFLGMDHLARAAGSGLLSITEPSLAQITSRATQVAPRLAGAAAALARPAALARLLTQEAALAIFVMSGLEVGGRTLAHLAERRWEEGDVDLAARSPLASFAVALQRRPGRVMRHVLLGFHEALGEVDWFEKVLAGAGFAAGYALATLVFGPNPYLGMFFAIAISDLAVRSLLEPARATQAAWHLGSTWETYRKTLDEVGDPEAPDLSSRRAAEILVRTLRTLGPALVADRDRERRAYVDGMRRLAWLGQGRMDTETSLRVTYGDRLDRPSASQMKVLARVADELGTETQEARRVFGSKLVQQLRGFGRVAPWLGAFQTQARYWLEEPPRAGDAAGPEARVLDRSRGGAGAIVELLHLPEGRPRRRRVAGSLGQELCWTMTGILLEWADLGTSDERVNQATRKAKAFVYLASRTRLREAQARLVAYDVETLASEARSFSALQRAEDSVDQLVSAIIANPLLYSASVRYPGANPYLVDEAELGWLLRRRGGGATMRPVPEKREAAEVRREIRGAASLIRELRILETLVVRTRSEVGAEVPAYRPVRPILHYDRRRRQADELLGSLMATGQHQATLADLRARLVALALQSLRQDLLPGAAATADLLGQGGHARTQAQADGAPAPAEAREAYRPVVDWLRRHQPEALPADLGRLFPITGLVAPGPSLVSEASDSLGILEFEEVLLGIADPAVRLAERRLATARAEYLELLLTGLARALRSTARDQEGMAGRLRAMRGEMDPRLAEGQGPGETAAAAGAAR